MAAVRSVISFVVRAAPHLDALAAELVCRDCLLTFDRTFGSISDRTGPEADGGALEDAEGMGDWARDDPEEPGFED